MARETQCNRQTDCAQCPKATEGILVHRKFPKGQHFPPDKCTQNCILFILQGELLVNSEEYPGTTLREGQFILQSIGSKLELLALTDVNYVVYWFNEPPLICEQRYHEILQQSEAPLTYTPLVMTQRITNFMKDICDYLDEQMPCGAFIDLKCQELMYLIICYYPRPQLSKFFLSHQQLYGKFPIFRHAELRKGEKRRGICTPGRLYHYHFSPFIQEHVWRTCIRMDSEQEKRRHPGRPPAYQTTDHRDQ